MTRSSLPPSAPPSTPPSIQPGLVLSEKMGGPAFRLLKVTLHPGSRITAEPGAMASQDATIETQVHLNGTLLNSLFIKFLGKESLFLNRYTVRGARPATLFLTQSTPGEIVEHELKNETVFIESGSFVARTSGIRVQVRWAGIASWISGEGLFKLAYTGTGKLWYGCYGAVIEKEVVGDTLVDAGHLLAYPPSIQLSLRLSGGLFSSLFSGEGFVLKLKGSGKIRLQTRSVKGLAQWLNPRFWS